MKKLNSGLVLSLIFFSGCSLEKDSGAKFLNETDKILLGSYQDAEKSLRQIQKVCQARLAQGSPELINGCDMRQIDQAALQVSLNVTNLTRRIYVNNTPWYQRIVDYVSSLF